MGSHGEVEEVADLRGALSETPPEVCGGGVPCAVRSNPTCHHSILTIPDGSGAYYIYIYLRIPN